MFSHVTEDGAQQLWIGRVLSNPKWSGWPTRQNKTTRIISYDGGLKVGPNEVAICIMWYEVVGAGIETLEYQLSR